MAEEERKIYLVRIGRELMEKIEVQKERIKKATQGCVQPTTKEAGELLARKIKF